jgi:protein-S-isoprenylcysteine O-methyltransferase Ste14
MKKSDSVERGADVRFPPPLVFLAGVLIGAGLHQYVRAAPVPVSRTISVTAGGVLIVVAIALAAWARGLFVRTGQSVIPWTPTPEMIFGGPYRFTRNPMYVGMTLLEIGIGLVLNNLWVVALALPALLIIHFIAVRPEEAYLSQKFGDGYRGYLQRVRRYL